MVPAAKAQLLQPCAINSWFPCLWNCYFKRPGSDPRSLGIRYRHFIKVRKLKEVRKHECCSVCALLREDIQGGFIVCWSLRRNVTKSLEPLLLPLKREQAVSLYDPCIRIVIRQTVWFWTVSIEFQYYCGAGLSSQLTAHSQLWAI